MNYYYFSALYFDARHQHDDEVPICKVSESLEDATERARKEALEFENRYPYKILIKLKLEMTIPAATVAKFIKEGVIKGGND